MAEAVYHRILKQLFFSYFVNIIVFIIVPLGTVVLSRGLSLVDFGVYSLFFIWWNIGLQICPLGFQMFIRNYLPGRSSSEQYTVVGSLFRVLFLVWIFALFTGIFFIEKFLSLLHLQGYFFEMILVLIAVFISILAFVVHGWITARQELEFASFLFGVNSTVWIILSVIEFLLFGKLVLWHVTAYWIFGVSLQLVLSLLKFGKESRFLIFPFNIDFSFVKNALYFGLPLTPLIVSQWLLTTFDRSLLSLYKGNEVLGLYALAYALVSIVASFGNIVVNIFYPYVAQANNAGQKKEYSEFLNASLKYTLLVVVPGIAGVYVFGSELITLIASAKFIDGVIFVKYLLLFPLFSSLIIVLQTAILVSKGSGSISIIYFFSFLLNYFLNRMLIPSYGGVGAALSTVITYFVLAVGLLVLSRGLFKFEWNFIKIGRIFVCAVFMAFVLSFFSPQTAVFKLLSILFGVFVYFLSIILCGVFGRQELSIAKNLLAEKIGKLYSFT